MKRTPTLRIRSYIPHYVFKILYKTSLINIQHLNFSRELKYFTPPPSLCTIYNSIYPRFYNISSVAFQAGLIILK